MKYVKMLGLAALAAALMAFVVAGTASATILTGAGGTQLLKGTKIVSAAEGTTTLHPPIGDISCENSTVEGEITREGSASETPFGPVKEELTEGKPLDGLTFTGCNAEVVVLKTGSLEIHTKLKNVEDPGGVITEVQDTNNGTLTSTGAKVTVTFLGFHCIFTTNSTDIGTVTGSANTGATATLDIEATIPRTEGRSGAFCGSSAKWTGSYKVSTPDTLNVD